MITASPLGEEEPDPKDAERGGYSPIPRRDARVGEWDSDDTSAESNSAVSRIQRRARCRARCEEWDRAGDAT